MSVLSAEILQTFTALLEEAEASADPEPTAMTVATVGKGGRPSARTVLLKGVDERGFVFFTNFTSRKGQQLAANPQAALLFHWKMIREGVQVKIEGSVEPVTRGRGRRLFRQCGRGRARSAPGPRCNRRRWNRGKCSRRGSPKSRSAMKAWKCRGRRTGRDSGSCPSWSNSGTARRYRLHERQRFERVDGKWQQRMLFP